jgi:hypothetical protein
MSTQGNDAAVVVLLALYTIYTTQYQPLITPQYSDHRDISLRVCVTQASTCIERCIY